MMTDTPRTDAARISAWGESGIENSIGFSAIPVEFARQLERELAEAKRNYMDLIMSVENKYPNETRHETAKRYIRERENTPSHGPDYQTVLAMAAKIRKGE